MGSDGKEAARSSEDRKIRRHEEGGMETGRDGDTISTKNDMKATKNESWILSS
jgi:hypothetical protein